MVKNQLRLSDILIAIVLSVAFGILYKLWSPIYYLTCPFGIHINQLIYGMWFIAGNVAYLLIRKPGIGLLAETAAASGELLMGSEWGLEVMIYGLAQGLIMEAVFFLFRYKQFHLYVVLISSLAATIASLSIDLYKGNILYLENWNLALLVVNRSIGALFFSGYLSFILVRGLEKTGITQLIRHTNE